MNGQMKPTFIFGSDFNSIVLPLLSNAKEEILLVIFDWRFESLEAKTAIQLFNRAIIDASQRGVIVRAVVNHRGVAQRLLNLGIKAKVLESQRLLHTKMLLIDGKKVIVGSHNYSQSAFTSNYELSVFFDFFENVDELITYFNNLWSY